MSGLFGKKNVTGEAGCTISQMPVTETQTIQIAAFLGISGWLLASLVRTPLPGADSALLASSLGALIMWAFALRLRRHILR